jgi:predicted ribosomally synthesized peptide with SipW-like signal peptide
MKKLFGLTIAALLIIGMVGGGTWAYFSDPEASTGNTFAAGTLDLDWAGGDALGTKVLDLSNKAPGDSDSASQPLANSGSLDGELDITFSAITNTESTGTTEYEDDGGLGELGANAWMAVWLDYEDVGSWSADDVGLKSDGTTYAYVGPTTGTATGGSTTTVVDSGASWTGDEWKGYPVTVTGKGTRVVVSNTATTLTVATPFTSAVVATNPYSIADGPHYDLINNYGSDSHNAAVVTMQESGTAGDSYDCTVEWVIPITVGNTIQGDSLSFNITFTLEQPAAD